MWCRKVQNNVQCVCRNSLDFTRVMNLVVGAPGLAIWFPYVFSPQDILFLNSHLLCCWWLCDKRASWTHFIEIVVCLEYFPSQNVVLRFAWRAPTSLLLWSSACVAFCLVVFLFLLTFSHKKINLSICCWFHFMRRCTKWLTCAKASHCVLSSCADTTVPFQNLVSSLEKKMTDMIRKRFLESSIFCVVSLVNQLLSQWNQVQI